MMHSLVRFWSRLFPNPRFYGWAVVGVGFLCSALSSPGQSFAISLYLDHLIADLGISRVELSSLYAVATLLAAACLPLIGGLSDRVSGRRFLTPVLVLLAGAMLFLSQAQSVLALGAAFFALRVLGQGAIGLGTLTLTVRWFRRFRGRALAVVSLGYAFGEIVFPGAIYALIEAVGWRGSLVVLAGVYLLLFTPLAGALLYGSLLGLGAGTVAAANSIVWPDYFGIDALGAIKGVVNGVRNGATAIGPPLAAVLMTAEGSFAPALLAFGGMAAVAGIGALALAPPSSAHPFRPAGPLEECTAGD